MSYNYEYVPFVIWGSGHEGYGDKDAKRKVVRRIKKVPTVFVDSSRIREYEARYNVELFDPYVNKETLPYVYKFGAIAYAIPSEHAVKILKDFKTGHFEGFMLRDINLCTEKALVGVHIENVTDEHWLLDFNASIYGTGQATDHCYD